MLEGDRSTANGASTILFGQEGVGIVRVPSDGGGTEVLVPFSGAGEAGYGPQILPGGRSVLLTLGGPRNWNDARIVVHSLETGKSSVVVERGRDARYLPTGHLVYVVDRTLMAAPFDVDTMAVTGGAVTIAENLVQAPLSGAVQFSVSSSGTLIYAEGDYLATRTLVWVDREGTEESIPTETRAFTYVSISPDGSRAALDVRDADNEDIWIWYFDRQALTRLTFAPGRENYPVWSPDGTRVAFSSDRNGAAANLYWNAADGTGAAERLSQGERHQYPTAFSPDGEQLFYNELGGAGLGDLRVLTLGGSAAALLVTEHGERNAVISPDGRWLAYQSGASGQSEIYVRPFPNIDDGQWPISNGGGTRPLWSRNGRELFYLNREGGLVAVEIQGGPGFAAGRSEEIVPEFYAPSTRASFPGRTYDVSPDGKRFLTIKESPSGDLVGFVVVLNWFEELKRLVPTEN